MNKYMIIGASGFLGSFLYNSLNNKGLSISGTHHQNKNDSLDYLDLENLNSIRKVIENTEPDILIHTGGLTDTNFCEKNQEHAFSVNVEGTKKLVSTFNGKIIYFSTDYVFNGNTGDYNEDSSPNPINYYGFTKMLAEQEVLNNSNNLVVRVSGLYGNNPYNNRFLNSLDKNEIKVYDNLISSPTYIKDIVKEMDILVNLKGTIHFTGSEALSRYEFTKKIVRGLELKTQVIPHKYNAKQTLAKIPLKSNLSTKYNFFNVSCLDDALIEMKKSQ